MTAAAFDYHAPTTIDDAVNLLGRYGDEARLLAGGQSLMPMLASRLAQPSHVIDLNRLEQAARPSFKNGRLRIPPLMRHADFETPVEDGPLGHILAGLAKRIANYPVRLRGTFCGALAHGDPASKWCLAAAVLQAEMTVRSVRGTRTIPAVRFFETILNTALADDEMLVEVQIPLLAPYVEWGFDEVVSRRGSYPLAAGLVTLERDVDRIAAVKVGVAGIEDVPRRLPAVEEFLLDRSLSFETNEQAAEIAAEAVDPLVEPGEDVDYGRDLARAVVMRALTRAGRGP